MNEPQPKLLSHTNSKQPVHKYLYFPVRSELLTHFDRLLKRHLYALIITDDPESIHTLNISTTCTVCPSSKRCMYESGKYDLFIYYDVYDPSIVINDSYANAFYLTCSPFEIVRVYDMLGVHERGGIFVNNNTFYLSYFNNNKLLLYESGSSTPMSTVLGQVKDNADVHSVVHEYVRYDVYDTQMVLAELMDRGRALDINLDERSIGSIRAHAHTSNKLKALELMFKRFSCVLVENAFVKSAALKYLSMHGVQCIDGDVHHVDASMKRISLRVPHAAKYCVLGVQPVLTSTLVLIPSAMQNHLRALLTAEAKIRTLSVQQPKCTPSNVSTMHKYASMRIDNAMKVFFNGKSNALPAAEHTSTLCVIMPANKKDELTRMNMRYNVMNESVVFKVDSCMGAFKVCAAAHTCADVVVPRKKNGFLKVSRMGVGHFVDRQVFADSFVIRGEGSLNFYDTSLVLEYLVDAPDKSDDRGRLDSTTGSRDSRNYRGRIDGSDTPSNPRNLNPKNCSNHNGSRACPDYFKRAFKMNTLHNKVLKFNIKYKKVEQVILSLTKEGSNQYINIWLVLRGNPTICVDESTATLLDVPFVEHRYDLWVRNHLQNVCFLENVLEMVGCVSMRVRIGQVVFERGCAVEEVLSRLSDEDKYYVRCLYGSKGRIVANRLYYDENGSSDDTLNSNTGNIANSVDSVVNNNAWIKNSYKINLWRIKCIREFCMAQEVLTARYSAFNTYTASTDHFTNPDTQPIRTVHVHPLAIVCMYPKNNLSNRILRNFSNMIRITFKDTKDESTMEYIREIMSNGITIDRPYYFVATSSSQLRANSAWFISPYRKNNVLIGSDYVRNWMGVINCDNIGKYMIRVGLGLSSTFNMFEIVDYVEEDDIVSYGNSGSVSYGNSGSVSTSNSGSVSTSSNKNNNSSTSNSSTINTTNAITNNVNDEYVWTDGIGRISNRVADMVAKKLKLTSTPTAFQIRFAGYKGVLVRANIPHDLMLRKSMRKFKSTYNVLEVVSYSQSIECYLNRQIIMILEGLGVPKHNFICLQNEYLMHMYRAINHSLIGKYCRISGVALVDRMSGALLGRLFREMCAKGRIFVKNGIVLMGVIDEEGVLGENEVFLRIYEDDGDVSGGRSKRMRSNEIGAEEMRKKELFERALSVVDRSGVGTADSSADDINTSTGGGVLRDDGVVVGGAIVAKNPCLHPGDIRKVQCVYKKELMHYKNVLVFSKKGRRPVFNMCSGSDLDGDLYFVSWDARLIPPIEHFPQNYQSSSYLSKEHIVAQDMVNFFTRFAKEDELGKISNAHLVYSDVHGITDPQALKLAYLFSMGVDFPKTGYIARLPQNLEPYEYPDFMERMRSYESVRVMGMMYRRVQFNCEDVGGVYGECVVGDMMKKMVERCMKRCIDRNSRDAMDSNSGSRGSGNGCSDSNNSNTNTSNNSTSNTNTSNTKSDGSSNLVTILKLILKGARESFKIRIPKLNSALIQQATKDYQEYRNDVHKLMVEYDLKSEYDIFLKKVETDTDSASYSQRITKFINHYSRRFFMNSYTVNGESVSVKEKALSWFAVSYGKGVGESFYYVCGCDEDMVEYCFGGGAVKGYKCYFNPYVLVRDMDCHKSEDMSGSSKNTNSSCHGNICTAINTARNIDLKSVLNIASTTGTSAQPKGNKLPTSTVRVSSGGTGPLIRVINGQQYVVIDECCAVSNDRVLFELFNMLVCTGFFDLSNFRFVDEFMTVVKDLTRDEMCELFIVVNSVEYLRITAEECGKECSEKCNGRDVGNDEGTKRRIKLFDGERANKENTVNSNQTHALLKGHSPAFRRALDRLSTLLRKTVHLDALNSLLTVAFVLPLRMELLDKIKLCILPRRKGKAILHSDRSRSDDIPINSMSIIGAFDKNDYICFNTYGGDVNILHQNKKCYAVNLLNGGMTSYEYYKEDFRKVFVHFYWKGGCKVRIRNEIKKDDFGTKQNMRERFANNRRNDDRESVRNNTRKDVYHKGGDCGDNTNIKNVGNGNTCIGVNNVDRDDKTDGHVPLDHRISTGDGMPSNPRMRYMVKVMPGRFYTFSLPNDVAYNSMRIKDLEKLLMYYRKKNNTISSRYINAYFINLHPILKNLDDYMAGRSFSSKKLCFNLYFVKDNTRYCARLDESMRIQRVGVRRGIVGRYFMLNSGAHKTCDYDVMYEMYAEEVVYMNGEACNDPFLSVLLPQNVLVPVSNAYKVCDALSACTNFLLESFVTLDLTENGTNLFVLNYKEVYFMDSTDDVLKLHRYEVNCFKDVERMEGEIACYEGFERFLEDVWRSYECF
ncbi:hypothetical protein VCUG_02106 [Vavraia culicis subsp. floridensis]|uniref:RDRP core domain-containing protein n=1 Tax=Vavraia culicis (isolate floridensis) TaxID=948595 RepID=L2GT28_VAVCU|nr:uncharacterized protein VCUG_02106 [Vavraia culicis subsp. floridensis]ELA46428.1 hypothetical protein VCUG_02106 [Vavraia culicis subsp. floridensis]